MDADKNLLKKTGLDFDILDSGCCGMAGYFGYEKGDHYTVSIGAGERVLLPAVRKAADTTLIIADGFSCREQIEQETDRKGLHIAQVLDLALKGDLHNGQIPEKKYLKENKIHAGSKQKIQRNVVIGLGVGIAVIILSKIFLHQKK